MNCLTVAIWVWLRQGCRGKIGILEAGWPCPHFAVFDDTGITHYKAEDPKLPYWRLLWFRGKVVRELSTGKTP